MRLLTKAIALLIAALVGTGPIKAQDRSITVGAPPGALADLLQALAPLFEAETGIAVKSKPAEAASAGPSAGVSAFLGPEQSPAGQPAPGGAERRVICFGEAVLLGSRADRARVRGLRDIKTAFRWISSARGLYVSSSPSLGLRELEFALWDSIGVNVRTRLTWYVDARGDEDGVFRQAANLGAYVLVERATFARQQDRRGLEVLVAGDPVLRTTYASHLIRIDSQEARAWHEWLSSDPARAAIAGWRPGGTQVFTPAGDQGGLGQGAVH